ncbi:MAG: hypothetical protein KAH04_03715 [Psychrilyobacter sp.]|nr:hypothetical protein [Psychrilyobacter sp.]
MKRIILYFVLATTLFASGLVDGTYSVTENVIRGKKWRSWLEIEVENNRIKKINYDMVTKSGDLLSKDRELERIIEEAGGIDPYVEVPRQYIEKIEVTKNYNMSRIDAIVGATVPTSKFNNMIRFLTQKAEKGESGDFKGWFN